MRYKKVAKTNQNTDGVLRPQYCTVKQTSIAVQNIRLCVQVNHVEQGTMRLAYSAISHLYPPIQVVFLTKIKNAIENLGSLISQ